MEITGISEFRLVKLCSCCGWFESPNSGQHSVCPICGEYSLVERVGKLAFIETQRFLQPPAITYVKFIPKDNRSKLDE